MPNKRGYTVVKVLVVVVILVIGLRLILTEVALSKLNEILAEASPDYSAHVDNLSLSFLRGAYRFNGIEAHLKNKDQSGQSKEGARPDNDNEEQGDQGARRNLGDRFMAIDYVDISLAWRDLFQMRLRTDIVISGLNFEASEEVIKALTSSKDAKKETEGVGGSLFPLEVSKVDILNSSVHLEAAPGLPPELAVRLTQIQGRLTNATPTESQPLSLLNLKTTVQEHSTLFFVGEADSTKVPTEWLMSAEIKGLKLKTLNPFLLKTLPISFNDGVLDAYAEFKGDKGRVEGYVKPFVKSLDVTGDEKDWKGFKHAGIEILTGAAKYLLRSGKDHTVATVVDLTYENGKLDYDLGEILAGAIEHGYKGRLQPGIENKFEMNYKKKGSK